MDDDMSSWDSFRSGDPNFTPPNWMVQFVNFRKQLFLQTVEPVIVTLLGPVEEELQDNFLYEEEFSYQAVGNVSGVDATHRRLSFLPSYVEDAEFERETTMTMASCAVLFMIMGCISLVFLSCFYHDQKTSPLFISPRRHRLPKLVPPPLPIDGYFTWIKVCFLISDEEIIKRIGFDTLIFLRFHRLALRCIVKMSIFSFVVLLPLNYTGGGGGHQNAQDITDYIQDVVFTDFMRFSMANIKSGSPRLWAHCFAAYLLTGIVVRELLAEYETYNSIRHTYLLSREPHLRTVLVTNIPRHLRSSSKITSYFRHVYPDAVKSVFMCQNLIKLENLVAQRTTLLANIEKEVLILCRTEKKKLFQRSKWSATRAYNTVFSLEELGIVEGAQERLATMYAQLEELNSEVETEQRRRRRIMTKMDRMEAGEGKRDIDYILAAPFVATEDANQRRVLGLEEGASQKQGQDADYQLSEPDGGMQMETLPGNNEKSQLRSRSPSVNGKGEPPKLSGKPRAKAKTAIRRYSQQISNEASLFGRPLNPAGPTEKAGYIEEHVNEVTDKAFVVMSSYTAATIAIQSMHSSKPGAMQVNTAPEPRDVLWNNIYISKGATRTRSIIGDFLVILIISFYIVPIALISLLVSETALVSISPRLAQLDKASALFASGIAMVQPICIVSLQQALPPLLMAIGRMEGCVSFSEVQMRSFSRYFLFQVLNVFLVTTIAGSVFDTIAIIVENPETAFEMLGYSLPRLSSFFITFVTIKTVFGLGVELVRTVSIIQSILRYFLIPNMTLRKARSIILGCRAIDDPGWFPFHKILAQDMLVVVISVVFAVIAPLVLFPCAIFCFFSRIMWTHHHMYVYESVFESGGQFWPKIFRRFVFGLIIAQMTITGQFILKEARHEAYATIALMFMTYLFLRSTRARYDPTSSTLPLEVATVMDISIGQEREAKRKAQEQSEYSINMAHSEDTLSPMASVVSEDREIDTNIGGHDPYDLAYLQPVLRANPRAKPEQPFPPAQLGDENTLFGSTDTMVDEGELIDCTGTVRLKSLNQQDRRVINKWWDEQLKRAGRQNLAAIAIGSECGTLSIGERRAAHTNPYHAPETPTPANGHQFV
ncbi:MAG: hypothetical protein SGBAC_002289 [Bacillariaceae sp.]